MYVPYVMVLSMSGVTWPTMKLFIQLLEAPRETPYGRVLRGQISATMIQAQGPQLHARITMSASSPVCQGSGEGVSDS